MAGMSIENLTYLGDLADWFEDQLERTGIEVPDAGKCLMLPRGHVEHITRQLRVLGMPAEFRAQVPATEEEEREENGPDEEDE